MPDLPVDTIILGDCLDVLRGLPDASVDCVVTDPPYGLGTKDPTGEEIIAYLQGGQLDTGGDFMGKSWDIPTVEVWRECLRVLKSGGYLLSFAGTRTWDIMSIGIRAAGFEDRDTIADYSGGVFAWMHGQGFPKSLDISKAIDKMAGAERDVVGVKLGKGGENLNQLSRTDGYDSDDAKGCGAYGTGAKQVDVEIPVTAPTTEDAKKWAGYGTALKPSWEPILVFRKPLDGTVAANVLEHGTGGLNIDGCRVAGQAEVPGSRRIYRRFDDKGDKPELEPPPPAHPGGRWPPNLVLCHAPECRRVGTKQVQGTSIHGESTAVRRTGVHSEAGGHQTIGRVQPVRGYSDEDGTETVDAWECVDGCPVKLLDEQSGNRPVSGTAQAGALHHQTGGTGFQQGGTGSDTTLPNDSGGASRFFPQFEGQEPPEAPFFYTGKATKSEVTLDGEVENVHPTRKPLALMKWLVKLVCPPKGIVLDPFCGSGTTCVAAVEQGSRFIGIERDPEYHAIASKRVGIVHEERQEFDQQLDLWDAMFSGERD